MSGHSSIIHINLEVNEELFKITHLGGGYFRLFDNPFISAGDAKIRVIVDGKERITEIVLNEDIPAGCLGKIYFSVSKPTGEIVEKAPELEFASA